MSWFGLTGATELGTDVSISQTRPRKAQRNGLSFPDEAGRQCSGLWTSLEKNGAAPAAIVNEDRKSTARR